jgi:hypothetical protein
VVPKTGLKHCAAQQKDDDQRKHWRSFHGSEWVEKSKDCFWVREVRFI